MTAAFSDSLQTQYAVPDADQTAQSQACSIMENPHGTGLDDCLRITDPTARGFCHRGKLDVAGNKGHKQAGKVDSAVVPL